MTQKQSIFGRIAQLTRANINALLDQAEDPEKMLDQLIRDFTSSIADAEDATAATIGNLRLLEADKAEDEKAAGEWGTKAAAASQRADQLRAEGNAAEADRFDGLAKYALESQISYEREIEAALPQIAAQTEVVDKLKAGLDDMRQKLGELRRKRDELVARARAAEAQGQVMDAMRNIDVLDPSSELSRFEERIRRDEARVAGRQELQATSLDSQFAELKDLSRSSEVERRLAALKGDDKQAIEG